MLSASLLRHDADSAGHLPVYRTLKTKDSHLFAEGFNACNISRFAALVSKHFEFCSDKQDIITYKAGFGAPKATCLREYKARRPGTAPKFIHLNGTGSFTSLFKPVRSHVTYYRKDNRGRPVVLFARFTFICAV
jgi:hypothetical protein